jgi:uncharacterized membrane protein
MKKLIQNPCFLIVIITIAGAGLRFYNLGFKTLWIDEAVIYLNSIGSFSDILHKNALKNSAPPAFTLLIRLITYVGHSEFWLRFPSCLAGILAIPTAYFAFKSHAEKWGAVLGSLLLAFSPMQIRYSQELREYSFVVLLTLMLIYFMTRLIEHKDIKHSLLFALAAAISIQFQYGLALAVAVFCVIILLYCVIEKDRKIGLLFVGLIPIILSVLLVWYISLKYHYQQGRASSYLSGAYFDGSAANLPGFLIYNTESILRFSFNDECKSLLLLLVIIGCCYSIAKKRYLPLLITFGLFGFVLLTGLLSLYPYGGIRQTLFLSVPLYLMASVGIHYLRNTKAYCAIGALAGLFLIYGTMDSFAYINRESRENMKPILAILNKDFQPEDRVFVSVGSKPAFDYYFDSLSDSLIFPSDYYGQQRILDYKNNAEVIAAQPERIWVLFTHYPEDELKITINTIKEKRKIQLVSPENENTKLYLVTDTPN